jgi:hypothetical protein
MPNTSEYLDNAESSLRLAKEARVLVYASTETVELRKTLTYLIDVVENLLNEARTAK